MSVIQLKGLFPLFSKQNITKDETSWQHLQFFLYCIYLITVKYREKAIMKMKIIKYKIMQDKEQKLQQ